MVEGLPFPSSSCQVSRQWLKLACPEAEWGCKKRPLPCGLSLPSHKTQAGVARPGPHREESALFPSLLPQLWVQQPWLLLSRASGRGRNGAPLLCRPSPATPAEVLGLCCAHLPQLPAGQPLSLSRCLRGGRGRELSPPHLMGPAWLPPRPQQGYLVGGHA